MLTIEPDKDFYNGLLEQSQSLRDQDVFTDVVLELADSLEIQAHRVVLASHSPFLRYLMDEQGVKPLEKQREALVKEQEALVKEQEAVVKEQEAVVKERGLTRAEAQAEARGRDVVVDLKFLDASALEKLVAYFYSGHLDLSMEEARGIMEAVDHLEIEKLHGPLSDFIIRHLDPGNCIEWFLFADECSMAAIHATAKRTLLQNARTLTQTLAFLGLDARQVAALLGGIHSEGAQDLNDIALHALFRWITHGKDRGVHLDALLAQVQLEKCSQSLLNYILHQHHKLVSGYSEKFIAAIRANIPEWIPWEERSVLVLGGKTSEGQNLMIWELDVTTGDCTQAQRCVPQNVDITKAAACATPRGVLFAGARLLEQNTSVRGNIVTKKGGKIRHRVVPTRLELSAAMCVEYDRQLQRWVMHADMPGPAHPAAAVYHRAKVYVLGGVGLREKRVDCLNTDIDSWTKCPPMPCGLSSASAVAMGDSLYAMEVTPDTMEVQCYDIASATWSLLKPSGDCPGRTHFFGSVPMLVALGTWVFISGGTTNVCFKYDTRTNTMTRIQSSVKSHLWGAATVLGKHIILSGGYLERHTERYDPDTDTWELLPGTLPVSLMDHIMAA